MKISYVTQYAASDIQNWSGLGYYIARSLKDRDGEIDYIGNLFIKSEYFFKAKKLFYKGLGRQYLWDREPTIIKSYAQQVCKRLSSSTDIVFSPSSLPIAYLNSKKPKVIYTDSTFAGMVDYYSFFTNLCNETIKDGNAAEQQALDSCSLALYSSDWAAGTAMKYYNVPAEKIKVVPFGANIECDRTIRDIKEITSRKSKDKCILLFLAVEWERKGGNLVVEIAALLNKLGLKTEVNIIGIRDLPIKHLPPYIRNFGFISKSTVNGRNEIDKMFAESHFLILPSKADCTPIVFSEASSFGLPSISTKTGGIPTIVKNNVNGYTFDLTDKAEQYAKYILDTFCNYNQYQQLALSSFNDYKTRLNWNIAGSKIMEFIRDI